MATLVLSADRNEKLKHLFEFLKKASNYDIDNDDIDNWAVGAAFASLPTARYLLPMEYLSASVLLQHHDLCDSGVRGLPFHLST